MSVPYHELRVNVINLKKNFNRRHTQTIPLTKSWKSPLAISTIISEDTIYPVGQGS